MGETSTRPGRESSPDETSSALEHVTVELDDGSSECTIFPRDCSEAEILTQWVTAGEGAYVSLAEAQ